MDTRVLIVVTVFSPEIRMAFSLASILQIALLNPGKLDHSDEIVSLLEDVDRRISPVRAVPLPIQSLSNLASSARCNAIIAEKGYFSRAWGCPPPQSSPSRRVSTVRRAGRVDTVVGDGGSASVGETSAASVLAMLTIRACRDSPPTARGGWAKFVGLAVQ